MDDAAARERPSGEKAICEIAPLPKRASGSTWAALAEEIGCGGTGVLVGEGVVEPAPRWGLIPPRIGALIRTARRLLPLGLGMSNGLPMITWLPGAMPVVRFNKSIN